MTDENEIKKYTLPEYAVDLLVKSEIQKAATFDTESRQRMEYCKEDMELRRKTTRIYSLMFKTTIYQSVLFTAAFVWWVLK